MVITVNDPAGQQKKPLSPLDVFYDRLISTQILATQLTLVILSVGMRGLLQMFLKHRFQESLCFYSCFA